jgi:hypothetical protein
MRDLDVVEAAVSAAYLLVSALDTSAVTTALCLSAIDPILDPKKGRFNQVRQKWKPFHPAQAGAIRPSADSRTSGRRVAKVARD